MTDADYLRNLLLALDELGNAILGGSHDETISSRLGKHIMKARSNPIATACIWILNKLDDNHCLDAARFDRGMSFEQLFGNYVHHRRDGKH